MSVNRRGFLTGAVSVAALPELVVIRDDAETISRPVPPPGTVSLKSLLHQCTACNACVMRCPAKVLKPAELEYGFQGMMIPRMDFSRGYCRPDCTACGEACPTGAIRVFKAADKRNMRQALAVCAKASCLVAREGLACGNCATHCPYKAIRMEKADDQRAYPVVSEADCAGCGACEYHCPAKAITVVGKKGIRV